MKGEFPFGFRERFLSFSSAVESFLHGFSFVDHPAYPSRWNQIAQVYQTHLIKNEFQSSIEQIRISGYPSIGQIRLTAFRSGADLAISSIVDIPKNQLDWTEIWLKKPFVEYSMLREKGWIPFADRAYFSFRYTSDAKADAQYLAEKIQRQLPKLIDALNGQADKNYVDLTEFAPKTSAGVRAAFNGQALLGCLGPKT